MRGFTLNHVCQWGLFSYLVLFSFPSLTTAVSFDLTELRNKVAKIKVNPRGNLWATGHFMGKKSVMDNNPLLPSAEEQSVGALMEAALDPERSGHGDLLQEVRSGRGDLLQEVRSGRGDLLQEDLLQEVLRVALRARFETHESRWKHQETGWLMKILESYIQNSRK